MESLDRENMLVLQAVQASLGLISPDVLGISVEAGPGQVVIHFAVTQKTEEVSEDIGDIMFELDALLEGSELLASRIYLGVPGENWPGRAGRLIYLAKPS
jgi:hypothetical protein